MGHPFLVGLQKTVEGRKKKESSAQQVSTMPRVLMLNHSDMPSLKKRKPGDRVTAHVRGVIHSVDQDGNVQMHIQDTADPEVGFAKDDAKPSKPE